MNKHARLTLKITAIAAAVAAACGPAWAAEDDDVKALTKPQSNIEFGIGYTSNDSKRFGQYNGFNQDGGYGLLGGNLIKRDDETGTWMSLSGSNIGLDTQQLRFEHNRQGDWGYYLEYDETPRFNPYTVNTGLSGIGSPVQTINGVGRRNVDLDTVRETITLGFSKTMDGGLDFQARFRNEEKDGSRQWGQGGAPVNFLTEPINQTTSQLDLVLGYTGQKLQLTGGYYGTMFNNHNAFLSIPGSPVFTQMALPPGSQSHQLHLAGGYNFSDTTRGNFKVAYTRQTQTDQFFSSPPQLNTRTDLGGKVNTTLLQAGITARPLPKLTLLGNFRYDDRDDQTTIAQYVAAGPLTDGNNEPRSVRTTAGKAEASYALPDNMRFIGGIDFAEIRRNTSPVRIVSYRAKTDETTYRGELRRSISETLTGSVGYLYSVRDGTPFITTTNLNGTPGSNLIAPIHLADRVRNKIRITANWQVTEPLSLQFRLDDSHDNYAQRASSTLGPQNGTTRTYAVDASYAFDEKWQASAWYSRDEINYDQLQRGLANPYQVKISNVGDAFGLGVRGKPYSWLDVGADLSYQDITEENRQQALAGAATEVIPDIATKLTRAKLYANYMVKKNVTLRGTYIYDRYNSNDWTWNRWTYSDGTTVNAAPIQEAHFFVLAVNYKF